MEYHYEYNTHHCNTILIIEVLYIMIICSMINDYITYTLQNYLQWLNDQLKCLGKPQVDNLQKSLEDGVLIILVLAVSGIQYNTI